MTVCSTEAMFFSLLKRYSLISYYFIKVVLNYIYIVLIKLLFAKNLLFNRINDFKQQEFNNFVKVYNFCYKHFSKREIKIFYQQ